MRQAIVTKYLNPTNFRGSRVKAECSARSFTMSWDHELNPDENHALAARTLFKRLGWNADGRLIQGAMPDGGYCFVSVPKRKARP